MSIILQKESINENTSRVVVAAPHVAWAAKPGQFVVVIPAENAERIPLTIADFNRDKGTITVIFQIVGATTKVLDLIPTGGEIAHLLGPLGVPSHIEKYGTVVVIGGGVGIAEIYPAVKALTHVGNEVLTIIGARNKDWLIYEKELSAVSRKLLVTTDDGSAGRRGLVSDELQVIISSGKKIDRVVAVGPIPMMMACCAVTKPHGIQTIVSLNPLMLDATGMCGVCRVQVAGKTKFGCVDGPEFDGHQVDFDDLAARLKPFKDLEKKAMDHVCRLLGG